MVYSKQYKIITTEEFAMQYGQYGQTTLVFLLPSSSLVFEALLKVQHYHPTHLADVYRYDHMIRIKLLLFCLRMAEGCKFDYEQVLF